MANYGEINNVIRGSGNLKLKTRLCYYYVTAKVNFNFGDDYDNEDNNRNGIEIGILYWISYGMEWVGRLIFDQMYCQ